MPEQGPVAGETAVRAFLADPERAPTYAALFGGLCLGVAALSAAYDPDWRGRVFQAVNVGYRMADFGLEAIGAWLAREESSGNLPAG